MTQRPESEKRTFWGAVEFRWSLASYAFGIPSALASFALPAWFFRGLAMFSALGPAGWIVAGFSGLLTFAVIVVLLAIARRWFVTSGYDARLAVRSGSVVDPLARTFERKRIYMNDFVLPSAALIEGKTFIECEIVGPMNLLIDFGNRIDEPKYPISDAVILHPGANSWSAVVLRNCTFRACSFTRITFLFRGPEYEINKHLMWLNWITYVPPLEQPQLALNQPPTPLPAQQQNPPIIEGHGNVDGDP